jgi:hypothetical protein
MELTKRVTYMGETNDKNEPSNMDAYIKIHEICKMMKLYVDKGK